MTRSAECVGENDSVLDAATKLTKLDVGAMPICGEDNRLEGMLTDRDIVVKVLAQGRDLDPRGSAELAERKPVTSARTIRSPKRSRDSDPARQRYAITRSSKP
jgi:CBS domain-containing protein